LFTLSSFSPSSTDNASRSPTLVGRTLPRRFCGSKFGSGVDLTQSGCSASQHRDPSPPTNSSYLVAALNLHALSINSCGIRFFGPITEVGCAFQNQVFSISGLLPMLYLLPSISKKNLRYLGCTWYACCLLPASYDCLTLPGKARRASMRVFALSLPYSTCSSI
jgi:hypothetical protein